MERKNRRVGMRAISLSFLDSCSSLPFGAFNGAKAEIGLEEVLKICR